MFRDVGVEDAEQRAGIAPSHDRSGDRAVGGRGVYDDARRAGAAAGAVVRTRKGGAWEAWTMRFWVSSDAAPWNFCCPPCPGPERASCLGFRRLTPPGVPTDNARPFGG